MIKCPACSSSHTNPVSNYRFWQKGSSYLLTDYQMLVCSTCGLWFKDNLPSKETLKRHYESLNVEVDPWNYSGRLPHEQKLDEILNKLPDGSKVLDVGSWTGRLLASHHPRLKVYGIEPNASAATVAKQKGLHILGSEVTENLSSFDSFDCITMVDVFEHLREPMETLGCLVSALAPGGKLLIVTGQTDCFPVSLAGASYWYFSCSDHLVFLNRRFAGWLQEKMPEVKVDYSSIRHFDFQPSQFFYEFAWLLCWRFLSPHSPFLKLSLHQLPGFKRFERLRDTLVCGMWKDHALIQIRRIA
jgi:YgiT-type zinc finger domain-containing protein